MALITAQEASQKASQFHKNRQREWFEAMKSFAENELASMIEQEANAGHYCMTFNLPEHVASNTLKDYLAERGYTLEKGSNNQCRVSWQNQELPKPRI